MPSAPARGQLPLTVLRTADGGSTRRELLNLQRSAGNRAVVERLARRSPPQPVAPATAPLSAIAAATTSQPGLRVVGTPAPTEMPATDGIRQIKAQPLGSHAIGYTRLPYIRPPRLRTKPRKVEAGWVAPLEPTTVEKDAHLALYPGPGAHELRAEGERKVHGYMSEKVSAIVRQGEEEHLQDLEWARHLTYDRIAETVNALAEGGEPPVAETADDARKAACQQLRSALPSQLRWDDGQVPAAKWDAIYTELESVTKARDKGWHNVPDETIRLPYVEEELKQRLGIPAEDKLREYNHRGEIGQHLPAVIVPARFEKL